MTSIPKRSIAMSSTDPTAAIGCWLQVTYWLIFYVLQPLSFIITLEEVISAIFDRSFLKFRTLMVALLNVGTFVVAVEKRQHQH